MSKRLQINLEYLARTYGLEYVVASIEENDQGQAVLVLEGEVKK